MRSPFSDSFELQSAPFPVPQAEVEMNSPLTDNYNFDQEPWQETTDTADQYMPVAESELSGRALESAVELNEKYKTLYRWGGFIPLILPQIGVKPTDTFKVLSDPKEFTKAFARWQESRGISGTNLGVLGINNWTFLQKQLGFHSLGNKYGINVAKAVAANKAYESQIWKGRRNDIYSWLSSAKILPMALPVNDEHFGYAIADYQKAKGLTVDGILGPGTFNVLKNTPVAPPAPKPAPTPTPARLTPSKWHSILPNAVQSPTETFVNGNDAFRKMVEIIKTATQKDHFIYLLSGWVVDIDFCMLPNSANNLIDTSSTFRSLLTAAGISGVEIKIIAWNNPETLGDISKAETFINELRAKNNANAFLIRDNLTYGTATMKSILREARDKMDLLNPYLSQIDKWNEWYSKAKAFPNEGSHHEKILVVKGSKGLFAFCGGMDLHSNRIMGLKGFCCRNYYNPAHNCDLDDSNGKYNSYSRLLHDVHSLVEGNAAVSLLQRFIYRWNLHRVQFAGGTNQISVPALPNSGPVSPSTPFVKVLHTFNHPSDMNTKDRSILNTVKRAIEKAEKSVFFECQYMISPEIANSINKAVRTNPNLQVKIHTQDDTLAGADLMFPQKFRKRFFHFLFDGLNAAQKTRIQVMILDPASVAPVRRRVHSKAYIIDDELAIIGSANCNRRSMTFDSETAVALFQDGDPSQGSLVRKLKEDLQKDPFNKWINYKENRKGDGEDLDVRILLHPYYNVAKALLASTGPALPFTLDRMLALISALLQKAIDPYPDGEPALIVKEIEQEAAEIAYENELMQMEATPGLEEEFIGYEETSYEDFPQDGSSIAEPEYGLEPEYGSEPETIEGENYSETEDFYARPARPCGCHKKKRNNEMQDEVLAEVIEHQVRVAQKGTTSTCEGRGCWAKTVLNKLSGLNLPLNNTIDGPTKKALEDFQQRNNLPVSQKLDFATERALLEADAIQKHKNGPAGNATISMISAAKTKIEDWTSKGARGVKNKPQHILNSFRDPRKVWAFVLHQMAFKRPRPGTKTYSDPESYLNTGAHFCIMFDGRIIQLHPFSRMIWHGNCLSPRSVAVEFEGNFPNIKGRWWVDKKSKVQNKDLPTQAQFEAGRFLASYLKVVLGTTHIMAHRQSSASRENDPGPDIWYNVGQWAIDNLGMTDGGPSSKCGTGSPILPEWRSWADKTSSLIKKEFDEEVELEPEDFEDFQAFEEGEEWEDYHSEALHPDPMTEEENPEGEEDFFFEDSELIKDVTDATRLNRYYAAKVGWDQWHDKINDFLLPFSGQTNVSLGEEAFAQAVAAWQQQQGLAPDGVIGPKTWAKMKPGLAVPGTGNLVIPGILGKIQIDTSVPALSKSKPEYQFTPGDALWLARFVEGEAGGRDDADSHAVIWAMFNRFGILRHRVPAWTSLAVFLRKYSTPLQPVLNSPAAAERVWMAHKSNPGKYKVVPGDGYYPGTSIRKVQSQRHIDLQNKPWSAFPEYVRSMVTRILTGQIPNPGIGIATEFDSPNVFLKVARRKKNITGEPSYEEWKQYTIEHAKNKKLIWIGEKSNLNQRKNAFYIQPFLEDVPAGAVRVVPGPLT